MVRLFQLLAVVLAGTAAYLYLALQPEAAFVTAALAVVAFFLGFRFKLKEQNRVHEEEWEADAEGSETEEGLDRSRPN